MQEIVEGSKATSLSKEEEDFVIKFLQHIYAFVGINQYWYNILIPKAFQLVLPNPKIELTYSNNFEYIAKIFS